MREIGKRRIMIILSSLILFLIIVGCNMNSLKDTPIIPTISEELTTEPTNLPTQHSFQSTEITPPTISTQQPQPTVNIKDIVLTVARSDSIMDSLLFFDQEMNLEISSRNEFNAYLSSIDCHLLSVSDNPKGFEIIKHDYFGKVIKKVLALEDRGVNDRIYNFSISPSEQWLAYLVITGDWGMSYADAEIQDLRLLKIDMVSPQNARKLTNRGGARPNTVVWSPDGHYLAYTDLNDKSFPQVYLFDLDTGSITQISHFDEEVKNEQIITLKWSLDSKFITFAIYRDMEDPNQDTGAIYVYNLLNGDFQILDIDISFVHANDIWWGDDHRLLVNQRIFEESFQKTSFGIVWFDVEKNEIIRKLTQDEVKAESFSAIPLSDNLDRILITGLPFPEVYIYDFNNNKLTVKKQELIDGLYYFVMTSSGLTRSPSCKE